MLSAVMPNVVMLIVLAPKPHPPPPQAQNHKRFDFFCKFRKIQFLKQKFTR
jgi:hypothetical protein